MGRAAAHTQGEAEAEEPEVVGFAPAYLQFGTAVGDFSRIALSPLSTNQVRYKNDW